MSLWMIVLFTLHVVARSGMCNFDVKVDTIWEDTCRFEVLTNITTFTCEVAYHPINSTDESITNTFDLTLEYPYFNLHELQSATEYQMQINCSSLNAFDVISTSWFTEPEPPHSLHLVNQCSSSSCQISWQSTIAIHLLSHYMLKLYQNTEYHEMNVTEPSLTLTNLKSGTNYTVWLSVYSTYGMQSDWIQLTISTSDDIPPKPSNVTLTPLNSSSILLQWSPPDSPTNSIDPLNYLVSLQIDDETIESKNVTDTNVEFHDLPACKPMYATVASFNRAGVSELENSAVRYTRTVVDNLTVSKSYSQSQLVTWYANCPEGEYRVDTIMCDNDNGNETLVSNQTVTGESLNSTGLQPATEYKYILHTIETNTTNGKKTILSSISSACVITSENIPSAPINVTIINITSSQLHLTWEEPLEKNPAELLSYTIQLFIDNETIEKTVDDQTEMIFFDLLSCSDVTVRIQAINSAGSGPWSENVTSRTDVADAPIVTDVTVVNSTSSMQFVTWQFSSVPNCIYSFKVLKFIGCHIQGTDFFTMSSSEPFFESIGLRPNQYYQYVVYSTHGNKCNPKKVGNWSSVSDCVKTMEDIPSAPLELTINTSNTDGSQLHIYWREPQNKSADSLNYTIQLYIHNETREMNIVDKTEAIFTNLWSCANVIVRVQAKNNAGTGPWSENVTSTTGVADFLDTLKVNVDKVITSSSSGSGSHIVSWNDVFIPICSYYYTVKVTNCNGTREIQTIKTNNSFVNVEGLNVTEWYRYEVNIVIPSINIVLAKISECYSTEIVKNVENKLEMKSTEPIVLQGAVGILLIALIVIFATVLLIMLALLCQKRRLNPQLEESIALSKNEE